MFAPIFLSTRVFIEGLGPKMVLIPRRSEHFQIDFAAFERALTPPPRAWWSTPQQPSGVVYSRGDPGAAGGDFKTERRRSTATPSTSSPTRPIRRSLFSGFQAPGSPPVPDTIVCFFLQQVPPSPASGWAMCWSPGQAADSGEVYAAVAERGGPLGYVNAPACSSR